MKYKNKFIIMFCVLTISLLMINLKSKSQSSNVDTLLFKCKCMSVIYPNMLPDSTIPVTAIIIKQDTLIGDKSYHSIAFNLKFK